VAAAQIQNTSYLRPFSNVSIDDQSASNKFKNDDSEQSFTRLVFTAVLMKIATTFDDVIWLMPFVLVPNRSKILLHSAIYTWVCLFQAMLALVLSHGGLAAINAMKDPRFGWSSDKILTFFAGLSLILYGLYIAQEFYNDEVAFRNDELETEKLLIDSDPAAKKSNKPNAESRTSRSLFVVAFLFSLDDLTLLVSMLVGININWVELALGTVITASIIICSCLIISKAPFLASFFDAIPICAIVLAFGSFLSLKSLSMK
jgi:hypothetical protein